MAKPNGKGKGTSRPNHVWGDRWIEKAELPGGGQSRAYLVADRLNPGQPNAFLKVPKRVNEKSIARLEEEATALKMLKEARLVPKVLDLSKNSERPFLVMEYIYGDSLSDRVKQQLFSLDDSCNFVLGLLHTIEECHSKGIVHRDIKPGNIIVKKGSRIPYLIDFGVGYRESDDRKDLTYASEPFGNLFIRAPETLPGSANQRSPVQDLSSACAILLFVLTGESVGQFLNDAKELPHQRPKAVVKLEELNYPQRAQLQSIFDRAFNHDISQRFQSAAELKALVLKVMSPPSRIDQTVADHYADLHLAFGRATIAELENTDRLLLSVVEVIKQVYADTKTELGAGYHYETFVENSLDFGSKCVLVTRMFHKSNNQREFPCRYIITRSGSDIVVTTDIADYPNLKRTTISLLEQGATSDISLSAKKFLAEQLSRRLRLPNLRPIHRAVYEHIQSSRADLIQADIQTIRDAREEILVKGFEELSWLLARQGLILEWQRGSTTVITEAGPSSVDMPSVLMITTPGSNAKLQFWTDGTAEAVHDVTHTFPGGIQSTQRIISQFTQKLLDQFLQGKTVSSIDS